MYATILIHGAKLHHLKEAPWMQVYQKSSGSSFLSQLLLPTSSKPYYCFSSSPLKQSPEAAAAAAISKDASIFPDLKGGRSTATS
jgi:hypothetical protein